MLATSKKSYFQVITTMLSIGSVRTSVPVLAGARAIIMNHQYRLLAGGYDLETGHFRSG